MKKIAYQGVPGAYSYITAQNVFGTNCEFVSCGPFRDIFKHVSDGRANYGVVPIENTLAGSVYENYDLLEQYNLHVIAESKTRIRHQLMAVPGTRLQDITRVYSHQKALEQCTKFFEQHPDIEEVIHADTAGAAKFVAQSGNPNFAAIASCEAAGLYGLDILMEDIEDNPHNWTRFFIVSPAADYPVDANKASIMFSVSHQPGSLFAALKVLADNQFNMSKLQSRPIEGRPFEYYFYVDIELGERSVADCHKALSELKKHTHSMRILGFYVKEEIA